MLNLFIALFCAVMGYILIVEYGNARVASRCRKYIDCNIILACFDFIAAGINICKYFHT